jgi:hypothetical protein
MASNAEVKNLVIAVAERCLTMQAEHLAGMRTGCLSKINQWLEERQTMVSRLRQVLNQAQASAEVDPDLRDLLLDRIGSILDQEKILFSVTLQQQTNVKDQINTIRRGRRALNGYGPALAHCSPHYVSDKG